MIQACWDSRVIYGPIVSGLYRSNECELPLKTFQRSERRLQAELLDLADGLANHVGYRLGQRGIGHGSCFTFTLVEHPAPGNQREPWLWPDR